MHVPHKMAGAVLAYDVGLPPVAIAIAGQPSAGDEDWNKRHKEAVAYVTKASPAIENEERNHRSNVVRRAGHGVAGTTTNVLKDAQRRSGRVGGDGQRRAVVAAGGPEMEGTDRADQHHEHDRVDHERLADRVALRATGLAGVRERWVVGRLRIERRQRLVGARCRLQWGVALDRDVDLGGWIEVVVRADRHMVDEVLRGPDSDTAEPQTRQHDDNWTPVLPQVHRRSVRRQDGPVACGLSASVGRTAVPAGRRCARERVATPGRLLDVGGEGSDDRVADTVRRGDERSVRTQFAVGGVAGGERHRQFEHDPAWPRAHHQHA